MRAVVLCFLVAIASAQYQVISYFAASDTTCSGAVQYQEAIQGGGSCTPATCVLVPNVGYESLTCPTTFDVPSNMICQATYNTNNCQGPILTANCYTTSCFSITGFTFNQASCNGATATLANGCSDNQCTQNCVTFARPASTCESSTSTSVEYFGCNGGSNPGGPGPSSAGFSTTQAFTLTTVLAALVGVLTAFVPLL